MVMSLAEVGEALNEMFARFMPGEWRVYGHRWVDSLHPPCLVVGPATRSAVHVGSSAFQRPKYEFELRVWVDPLDDIEALPRLHDAIDRGTSGSIVDICEAATWAVFIFGEITTTDVFEGQGVYIEARVPISVTPTESEN